MKKKIPELLISSLIFLLFFFILNHQVNDAISAKKQLDAKFTELLSVNLNKELNNALLDDYIKQYYKGRKRDEIITYFKDLKVPESLQKNHAVFDKQLFFKIFSQYLVFIIYFCLILFFLYHLIERFAWLRFFLKRNYLYRNPGKRLLIAYSCISKKKYKIAVSLFFKVMIMLLLKYFSYFILLSPSFIIAYMFRFSIFTDNAIVFILLVVFTNGMLWSYLDKYYQMIENEINKEYVILAKVKGLKSDFEMTIKVIIHSVFSLRINFHGNVLYHVYLNLKKTQVKNIKELSVFLISSMLITEMSLNIQEHFSYELLKQLLEENFHIVILMIFLIYVLIKLTELSSDYFYEKKYMMRNK